jgi:hypothetical protein
MQRQTYLRDTGENDVKGIVIIETDNDDNDAFRVTENRAGEWCKPFWMPESELSSQETEVAGKLTSEQYLRVYEASGVSEQ